MENTKEDVKVLYIDNNQIGLSLELLEMICNPENNTLHPMGKKGKFEDCDYYIININTRVEGNMNENSLKFNQFITTAQMQGYKHLLIKNI